MGQMFISNSFKRVTGSAEDFGSSNVSIGDKEVLIPDTCFNALDTSDNPMLILMYDGVRWQPTPYPNMANTPCSSFSSVTVSTLGYLEALTSSVPISEVNNT